MALAVETADTQQGDASGTTWTCTYPTNLQAGDLILLFVATNNVSGGQILTAPAGWVYAGTSSVFGSGNMIKKKATGSESGTFDIDYGISRAGTWLTLRITGWDKNIGDFGGTSFVPGIGYAGSVLIGSSTSGTSTSPNSNALDPTTTGAEEEVLWIAAMGAISGSVSVSAFPTGYTFFQHSRTGNGVTLGVAMKSATGTTSENPGAFTISSSVQWDAATGAIRGLFGPTIHHGDTKTGVVTSNSSSWSLTYPTNLVSGDLILVFAGIDGAGAIGGSITSFNYWPTVNDGNPVSGLIAGKISDGTETGSFTLSLGASEQGGWLVARISDWYGSGLPASATIDQLNTVVNGDGLALCATGGDSATSASVSGMNPGNWDVENTLWWASLGIDTSRVPSAWPTSYVPGSGSPAAWDVISGGAGGATLSVQYQYDAAATAPTGSWTWTTGDEYVRLQVAVRPPVAAVFVPRHPAINHQNPGLLAKAHDAWQRTKGGIFVPRLWTPEGAQI